MLVHALRPADIGGGRMSRIDSTGQPSEKFPSARPRHAAQRCRRTKAPVRVPRPAVHAGAVQHGPAAYAGAPRCRRFDAGDLPSGLSHVRELHSRNELQGLAVHHPLLDLRQPVPPGEATAPRGVAGGAGGAISPVRPGAGSGIRHDHGRRVGEAVEPRGGARLAAAAGGFPRAAAAGRRQRVGVRGGRRGPGLRGRDRRVTVVPRPQAVIRHAAGVRAPGRLRQRHPTGPMTDTVNHLGATLQDFLDGRLDDTRQVEVRAHLDGCPQCRGELEALRWVRDVALKQLPGEKVPPGLANRVTAALDAADGRTRPAASRTIRRRWQWATAGALLAAGALALLLVSRPRADLVDAVTRDFALYSSGTLALDLRSSDGRAVESLYARGGIDFRTRVFDLGMMQYRLVGGRIHRLRGRPSALFAYRGPEGRDLVCQMYEGRLAELPRSDDAREHNGITFQVYRAGRLTLVFWQEGAVVCVLASDAESETVIQLAYAKAVKV